jgi:hypothetical protein
MSLLAILGMLGALGFGIFLGMPARYEADFDEIEEALSDPNREPRRVKRHTTPFALLQRGLTRGSHRRRGRAERQLFRMEEPAPPVAPKDRPDPPPSR